MIGSDRGANIELWARVPRLGRSVTIHHNSLQSSLEAARIGRWISERRPGTAWQGGGRSRPGLGRRLTTTPPGEAWASRARQSYPRGLLHGRVFLGAGLRALAAPLLGTGGRGGGH